MYKEINHIYSSYLSPLCLILAVLGEEVAQDVSTATGHMH